ncbi:MAG: hypothetical protein COW65_16815 [Cytophagales bacterium CG18_big_fil_WC_8_21_14_2_50_42_9]|nr:MAG: hypothetical protein COW65_16815 [Cytophagales bacterium CG18_big_fil_WC_8_21_14_2_50_42_9]
MNNNTGFINLIDETDLFKKLLWEYEFLIKNSESSFHAFNFFVTAFHLADWIYKGGTRNNENYTNFVKDNIVISLAGQIANGAKHFELKDKRYTEDKRGIKGIISDNGYVNDGYVQDAYLQNRLIIKLDNQAKSIIGESIEVIELADFIINFYNKTFKRTI